MKKRVLVLCLVMMTMAVALFATGEKENQTATSPGNTEKPVLKQIGAFLANFDPNNDPTQKAIEEKTGYKVIYSMLPQDNPEQRLNMELASGADYDILRMDPNWYQNLVKQNVFIPLDDLLDKYGSNLKTVISEQTWDMGKYNGKTYGIPMMNERANIESALILRKDILDKLGLSVPETPEEFHQVLKQVKEKYPDMIPFSAIGSYDRFSGLCSETIISAFGFYFDWNIVDGKMVNRVNMPEYYDYLSYLHLLYEEGLIDRDLAVNKKINLDEKFASGKVFAIPSGWFNAATQVPALKQNVPGAEVVYLTPFADKNGNKKIRANKYLNTVTAIPKTSKHPEDAIKFINAKLDDSVFTYITLGTEGETFTKNGSSYQPIMPIFSELRNNAWWYLNGIREKEYANMWLARTRRNEALGDAFDAVNNGFDKYAILSPTAYMPTLSSVSKYNKISNNNIAEYEVMAVTGLVDIKDHATFQKKWMDEGGQAMTDEINAWYMENK